MKITEAIKKPEFWKHSLRLAFMVLVLMTILSLLFNSFSDILSFDLAAVSEKNFANGNWIRFFIPKVLVAIFYSMWMTSKSMK